MKISARYQAILELLTEIFKDKKPADTIINDYIRNRKYIGSKDRKFICKQTWNIIRNRLKLEFESEYKDARTILLWSLKDNLTEIFDDSPYGLLPLTEKEQQLLKQNNENPYPAYVEAECPEWLFTQIQDIDFCKALNKPAEADFRAHCRNRDDVIKRLKEEGIDTFATPLSPYGFRSEIRFNVNNSATYQDGWFEVQDEASQIASILCDTQPEHKIIDYCCGAGGKSLAISAILNNQGKILAHDINSSRLEAIKPRISRLNIKNIELTDIIATSDTDFDRFIIDAPCSGSGTWRRSPDAKFRLTPKMLKYLNNTQSELLELAVPKTKVGGRIIYITCSILQSENEERINNFLQHHSEFSLLNISQLWQQKIGTPYPHSNPYMLRMSPFTTNTDGFFITILQKNS